MCLKGYVEFPGFLLYFCFTFSAAVTTNFIVYKTCHVTMNYNNSDCVLLGTNNVSEEINQLEKEVQPSASVLLMVQQLIGSIVPAVLSLFIGTWIDKHGRVPIILYVLGGNFVTYLVLVCMTLLSNLSPWWWLLTSLTTAIGGGETAFVMASICYMNDVITPNQNKGLRMTMLEVSKSIGALIGITSSAYAYNNFGYLFIYSMCALCCLLAILYTYFFLPESISNEESKNLFRLSLVKEMYKTCIKKRLLNNRNILWLLMTILPIFILAHHADKNIFFLFLREKFLWSLEKYTIYCSIWFIIEIGLTLSIVFFCHKLLRMNEMFLTMIGFLAMVATGLSFGLANNDIGINLGAFFKSIGGIVQPMIKSAISEIVARKELGQILAITSFAESITPLISSPIYTYIYNETLYTYPSAYNFITAAIHGLNFILLSILIWNKRMTRERELAENRIRECVAFIKKPSDPSDINALSARYKSYSI